MSRVGNRWPPPPNTDVLPESVDRFDLALAEWFDRHQGAWSGTATELIAALKNGADAGTDLWPQHGRAFFSQLESHKRTLRSLGVDVSHHAGFPRMISLRSCQGEKPKKLSSGTRAINCASDSHPVAGQQNSINAVSDGVSPADNVADARKHANEGNSARRIFENTAEALFCVIEMQDQIAEQAPDLKSTMDLVASRTGELIGCSGVAVGLLQQDTVVYPARVGIAVAMVGLPSQENLFHSCISKATVLPLPDAENDPVVGASCRQEGVRSLIVLPIFHNREVAGAMEFLFKEMRSFSEGDVMTLELIADLVSEGLAGAVQIEAKQPRAQASSSRLRTTESIEPQGDQATLLQAQPSVSQYLNSNTAPELSVNLESSIPRAMAALAAAAVPRKRVWSKLP